MPHRGYWFYIDDADVRSRSTFVLLTQLYALQASPPSLAFFLFNSGLVALVRPVPVDAQTRWFYAPVCAATVLLTSIAMATRRVPRWFGGVLVAIYIVFVGYGTLR